MKRSRIAVRMIVIFVASTIGLLLMAGCAVNFKWKAPALQISRTSLSTALNDYTPDIVRYGSNSYVVFYGSDGNDNELFLRAADQFASHVISSTQLTGATSANTIEDITPRIVAASGYLYIVYSRQDYGTNYQIYWMKVNASTLAIASGPTLVSTLPAQSGAGWDDTQPRIVHTGSGSSSQTNIVWVSEPSGGADTIYWNKVSDAGVVGTPVDVSTACGVGGLNHYSPRIVRSYPAGTSSMVAWYGASGSGNLDVYWRDVTNSTGAPGTCIIYTTADSAQDHQDVELASNTDSRSFLAWEDYDTTDYDAMLGSIPLVGAQCKYRATVYGVDDLNPDIAAGDVVSDWVHIAWEHNISGSDIWYNLYDASNCSSNPFSANTQGDANGTITMTVSPFPASDDAGGPIIAAATGSDILDTSFIGSSDPMQQQAWVQHLVENGTLSKAEADSLLADGQITADELKPMFQMRAARVEARRADSLNHVPIATDNRPDTNQQYIPDPPVSPVPDAPLTGDKAIADDGFGDVRFAQSAECLADPDEDVCMAALSRVSRTTPQAPTACNGINAQDAVAIAWLDQTGTTDRMYANELATGSDSSSYGCVTGYLADNGPVRLTRTDDTQDDNLPTGILVTNHGVAHVVWPGFALHGLFANDYDIFYAVTHIPGYLPMTLMNH